MPLRPDSLLTPHCAMEQTGLHVALLACPLAAVTAGGSRGRFPFEAHVARWVLQWHTFRIMFAAGLLKLRGRDPCWHDGTCLVHHYQNMPMPNPLTWHLHHFSPAWHKFCQYLSIHVIELVAVWGLLVPTRLTRHVGAIATIVLMFAITATGNYAFLNYTMALPCLAFLDDHFYMRLIGRPVATMAPPRAVQGIVAQRIQQCIVVVSATLLLALSLPGAAWLATGDASRAPAWSLALRERFEGLDVGNLYNSGRFAHVTKTRNEIVIWALECREAKPVHKCNWVELDIACKPGSLDRRPCVTAPYHRRLAWQFWFLALGHDRSWFDAFLERLARHEPFAWGAIEDGHPFSSDHKPVALVAHAYRYQFAGFDEGSAGQQREEFELSSTRDVSRLQKELRTPPVGAQGGVWWRRKHLGHFSKTLLAHQGG